MSDIVFSPSDVAFSGFRLIRKHIRAVLAWAGLQALFIVLLVVTNRVLLVHSARRFAEIAKLNDTDPAAAIRQLMALWPSLAPMLAVDLVIVAAFSAVQTSAILRAYLKPAEGGFGYIRFGVDELRIAVLNLLYSVLWLLYLFVITFISVMIGQFGGGLTGPAAVVLAFLSSLAILVAFIYPAVRLSLAQPVTFMEKRLHTFGSWRLTDGHFLSLAGAFVMTIILIVVSALCALVLRQVLMVLVFALAEGRLDIAGAFQPTAGSALTRAVLAFISLTFESLLLACIFAIWHGPIAAAYNAFVHEPRMKAQENPHPRRGISIWT